MSRRSLEWWKSVQKGLRAGQHETSLGDINMNQMAYCAACHAFIVKGSVPHKKFHEAIESLFELLADVDGFEVKNRK